MIVSCQRCKSEFKAAPSVILSGHGKYCSKSCANIAKTGVQFWKKHGHSVGGKRTKTFSIYHAMKERCLNPNFPYFHHYGGRGIKICDQWIKSFDTFLSDMGECPAGYSLERIDNERGYAVNNCKWIPRCKQTSNTRRNIRITINDKVSILKDWCKEFNRNYGTVLSRIRRGWDPIRAITYVNRGHAYHARRKRFIDCY